MEGIGPFSIRANVLTVSCGMFNREQAMDYKDYYQILGVERTADAEAIKRAYRKLARKFHPDVNKEAGAEARFKDIGEAYEVLKDPEKRAAYDRFGAEWQHAQRMGGAGAAGPEFRRADGGFEFHTESGAEFSEFFESLFGRAGAGRSTYAGMGGGAGFALRGEDQQVAVTITLEDAYRGAKRGLQLQRPVAGADGRIAMQPQELKVAIPKGIMAGQRIRLEGQGLPGHGGGPAGDLYLEIRFAPHPRFSAEGRDIHLKLPVAPWEAAVGASVAVPTLDGAVQLKIPAGSQSGRKLRLKGKGLATAKTAGDQIVELQVVLPEAKTDEQQALYRAMAEKMAFNPRANLGV